MSECPHSAETHRLLDGESKDPDAARAHLLDCAECRGVVEAGVQLQLLAAAAKARRDAALRDEMRDEIADLQDQLRRAGDELKSQADHQGETIARYARDEVALKARVEEAERERKEKWRECVRLDAELVGWRHSCLADMMDQRDAAESRAQRAEALLLYVDAIPISDDLAILRNDGETRYWIRRLRKSGVGDYLVDGKWIGPAYASAMSMAPYPDLDSALRALKDAGLLPDDVKVSE